MNNRNKWNKPSGKGPMGLDWSGVYPATIVPWTDNTCREIDEDTYRSMIRHMIDSGIAGLDPNEVEGLSLEETCRLIEIAKEESKGRIPVTGKIEPRNQQWTWDMVKEAEKVIETGADVLYLHPVPDQNNMEDFINLYKTFDKAFDLPIMALMVGTPPAVLKEIALACPNICAWKYESRQNNGLIKELVANMREVEAQTGRHVCTLRAGDHDLAESLVNGAEGTFNGGGCWRVEYDVAIVNAVKRGDLNEAFAIQKRLEPATDAVRGVFGTTIKTYGRFPYRYKITAWLLGIFPNYYARLPRTAFSDEEVLMLRDALIKAGFEVVRAPEECKNLGISLY